MSSVSIVLDNLNDKEVVHYSVLFIRGRIEAKEAKTLNGTVKLLHNGALYESEVHSGRFKYLIELKLGHNIVKISYKDVIYAGEQAFTFERRVNKCPNFVKLFYVIPSNDAGCFQSWQTENSPDNACNKIVTGFKLLQSFIAERLNEEGFGRKSFRMQEECEIFKSRHSKQEILNKTSEEIWTLFAKELLDMQVINDHCKVFAILSCTEYCNDSSQIKGHVACGRGQFAMLGSLGICFWADDVANIIDKLSSKESSIQNSSVVGFSGTPGECYSSTLGAALHELSHIFDLVHADSGIMARGFEDLDVFFLLNCDSHGRRTVKIEGNCGHGITVRPQGASKVARFRSGVQTPSNDTSNREGRAFYHRSGAVLLSAHPWFLQAVNEESEDRGSIQISGLQVQAPNGLRLIELHACDDYLVKYWDFTSNPVQLKRHSLTLYDVKNVPEPSLLVQDWKGRIVRKNIGDLF